MQIFIFLSQGLQKLSSDRQIRPKIYTTTISQQDVISIQNNIITTLKIGSALPRETVALECAITDVTAVFVYMVFSDKDKILIKIICSS